MITSCSQSDPPFADYRLQHFSKFKVKDIALRGNFGFAEFENALVCLIHFVQCKFIAEKRQDAEDAIREFDGRDFMGERYVHRPRAHTIALA